MSGAGLGGTDLIRVSLKGSLSASGTIYVYANGRIDY